MGENGRKEKALFPVVRNQKYIKYSKGYDYEKAGGVE